MLPFYQLDRSILYHSTFCHFRVIRAFRTVLVKREDQEESVDDILYLLNNLYVFQLFIDKYR